MSDHHTKLRTVAREGYWYHRARDRITQDNMIIYCDRCRKTLAADEGVMSDGNFDLCGPCMKTLLQPPPSLANPGAAFHYGRQSEASINWRALIRQSAPQPASGLMTLMATSMFERERPAHA